MQSHSLRLFTTLTVTVCAFALLAGCKVGPNYVKPDVAVPQAWQQTAPLDAKSAVQQDWWKHFHDPVLDRLIAKALAGNLDYQIMTARIEQARAMRASAHADLLPVVGTSLNGEREANRYAFGSAPIPGLKKPFDAYQAGFDASWELDMFGGRRRAVESAKAQLESAVAARDDARISVLAEVARTYIAIRECQQQLAVTRDTIRSQQDTLRIAKERMQAGTAPGLDVTQAHAQLSQSQSELSRWEDSLAQNALSMDVLLGDKPGTAVALIGGEQPIPMTNDTLVLQAPAAVIANRPDIREAERSLAAATAQQGVATAQLFPDLSLSGFLGFLSGNTDNLFDMVSKSWSFGGNLAWPILNYPKIEAGIHLADARQKEALIRYRKAVVEAMSDVERAVSAYTKECEHSAMLHATMEENARALDVARMRYKEGLTSFLEVLDAQRTLYASRSAAVEAQGQSVQDLIAVYKSLGGGWKDVPAAVPAAAGKAVAVPGASAAHLP